MLKHRGQSNRVPAGESGDCNPALVSSDTKWRVCAPKLRD